MKTTDLLLSSLSITEDEYDYKGSFFLGSGGVSVKVDISDLQSNTKIDELKGVFKLEEEPDEIRKIIMDMVMEKAVISSKITEGEEYEEKASRTLRENSIKSLDMA